MIKKSFVYLTLLCLAAAQLHAQTNKIIDSIEKAAQSQTDTMLD